MLYKKTGQVSRFFLKLTLSLLFSGTLFLTPDIALSQSIEELNRQGVEALVNNNYQEARRIWTDVLQLEPDNVEAYNNLGLALVGLERYDEAITVFKDGIQRFPKDTHLYNGLGGAFLRQGRDDEAIVQFITSIELDPDNADPYLNMAIALNNQGKTEEAVKYCDKTTKANPDHINLSLYQEECATAYFYIANTLLQKGELDKAIDIYIKLIDEHRESSPLSPSFYHNNLGLAYGFQEKLTEAINHFGVAIEIDPEYASAYFNLGEAKGKLGDKLKGEGKLDEAINAYEEAIIGYDKAIEIDPEYKTAIGSEYKNVYIEWCNALKEKGDSEKASNVCRKLDELNN